MSSWAAHETSELDVLDPKTGKTKLIAACEANDTAAARSLLPKDQAHHSSLTKNRHQSLKY